MFVVPRAGKSAVLLLHAAAQARASRLLTRTRPGPGGPGGQCALAQRESRNGHGASELVTRLGASSPSSGLRPQTLVANQHAVTGLLLPSWRSASEFASWRVRVKIASMCRAAPVYWGVYHWHSGSGAFQHGHRDRNILCTTHTHRSAQRFQFEALRHLTNSN